MQAKRARSKRIRPSFRSVCQRAVQALAVPQVEQPQLPAHLHSPLHEHDSVLRAGEREMRGRRGGGKGQGAEEVKIVSEAGD